MCSAVLTRVAKYSVVQAELPGHDLINIGVLLQDPETDSLHLRFRRDLELLAEEEDSELLVALADDLSRKASEMGAEQLLVYLEDTLSGIVLVTDRHPVLVDEFRRTVDRLYRQHVQAKVFQFQTHLPR